MKYLTLIRHAKAENAGMDISDAQRDLAERGVHDARLMGTQLRRVFPPPQIVCVSAAVRARRTVEELLKRADSAKSGKDPVVEVEEGLYLADPEDIWEYAHGALLQKDEVWVCAHDPGITEAIERFSGSRIERVPTLGIARIAWENLPPVGRNGSLLFFDMPANHRKKK